MALIISHLSSVLGDITLSWFHSLLPF
jgi:hypothetical protein